MYDRFEKEFKGDTLQDGTPTPSSPVEIQNVTGLQNIEVCGKNLFDKSKCELVGGVSFNNTENHTYTITSGTSRNFVIIKVQPSTIYTISVNRSRAYLGELKTKTTEAGNGSNSWIYSEKTFTTTPRTNYIGLLIDMADLTNFTMQVEQGSATEYEPYKGNTYEVNLGKNLFDASQENSGNIVVEEDGTLDISGISTSNGYCSTYKKLKEFCPSLKVGETYYLYSDTDFYYGGSKRELIYLSGTGANITWYNGATKTITQAMLEAIVIVYGGYEETSHVKIMITKGLDTDYSPYFTPIELNKIGDYQDSIKKSTGKNLFDKDNMNTLNAYINGSGIIKTDVNASVLYIPCKPNTSYAIQKPLQTTTSSNRFKVGCCSSIPTTETQLSKYNNLPNGTTNTTMIFETDSTANYLVFNFAGGNQSEYQNVINSIQIEENSQATDYEPYGKVWYIEKKIGKVVLDGSENWYKNYGDNLFNLTYDFSFIVGYGLSNYYKYNPVQSGINANTVNGDFALQKSGGYYVIFIKNTNYSTPSDFKTWLSTHNTEILYPLATPTYTEITNTELINQLESIELLKGTNNISITSEDLPVIFDYSFWNGDTEVDEDDRFLEVNQSNYLTSIELKDSCCVNNNILGTTYTKSAEVELLDLPVGTKLESQIITPEIGVKYNDDTTEYEIFDDYVIESLNDEQTASNTKFTAMNGSTLLDKEYICSLSFENGQTHTINEFYQDACNQIGLTPTDSTFDNSEIVMTGNPFTNKETIRTVISEVEKTSCSIAKFDWKNKTISLTWLSDQIDYEFNTSDYSTLEGSLTQYGPLNTIIIANTQLDGENVVMTDEESVAEYGEHQIIIDSPYFLYTEELRTQAIQAIYNKLDGLTYYDLKLTTPYGKPFLNIGDKIRINTNENQVLDTYVLSHTFKYDGTFSSIIESPALTQEEQTIKNEFKGNSVREKLRRTELMVDKTTGDITAITDRVTTVENEFGDVYSKEEVNTLVQNSATGITNTFVNSGGNNLLRNTGLWFEDRSEIEYMYPRTTGLYPSDELFMSADPHWEYWKGNAKKVKEDKAANMSGILLQTGYLEQQQQIRNGTYTLSFKYRKLIELATVNVQINDRYIDLTNIEDTEIIEVGEITAQNISIKIFSDTDDSCIIYDLMLNAGSEKAEYSQHQNETTTDTVNISKGITISSSDTNTTFKANSDGIRVYNSRDMDTPITEYTDTGMDTNRIKVKDEAEIVQVLWKNVGNNTWISRL